MGFWGQEWGVRDSKLLQEQNRSPAAQAIPTWPQVSRDSCPGDRGLGGETDTPDTQGDPDCSSSCQQIPKNTVSPHATLGSEGVEAGRGSKKEQLRPSGP